MEEWKKEEWQDKTTWSFILQANIKNSNIQVSKFLQLPGAVNLKKNSENKKKNQSS